MELLAWVNKPTVAPSGSSQQREEGGRDSWIGIHEDYGDIFRDCITKKEKMYLESDFRT